MIQPHIDNLEQQLNRLIRAYRALRAENQQLKTSHHQLARKNRAAADKIQRIIAQLKQLEEKQ